ncbi:MAG: hypothetical protein QOI80_2851 [Solirubrobacteraceae bacterium]|jgi:pimeloyl-ACP methyl ester carboxylesterase|nr:hypothetical protein [Solirubrobacteraceae bacterium]
MRGYAPTSIADGYSIAALACDAVALRWALAGDGPAVLVGHDWGAVTAYAVPAGVFDRVVTLSVPPPETLRRPPLRQLRSSWYMAFNQLRGLAERAQPRLVPKLWRTWSPAYDATEDLEHLRAAWPTREHISAALGYYRALRPSRRRSLPTTYLHGADDGCMLAEVAAGAVLVPGAGHFVQLERPEVVADYVSA